MFYFNASKPHGFFLFSEYQFYQKAACHFGGGGGGCTSCTLPQDPPLSCYLSVCRERERNIYVELVLSK